jgi:hypothetical protein
MKNDELLAVWCSLCVFVSSWILMGRILPALLIGIFAGVSYVVAFGRRWVLRLGFALTILAIGVMFGIPHPREWDDIAAHAAGWIGQRTASTCGSA